MKFWSVQYCKRVSIMCVSSNMECSIFYSFRSPTILSFFEDLFVEIFHNLICHRIYHRVHPIVELAILLFLFVPSRHNITIFPQLKMVDVFAALDQNRRNFAEHGTRCLVSCRTLTADLLMCISRNSQQPHQFEVETIFVHFSNVFTQAHVLERKLNLRKGGALFKIPKMFDRGTFRVDERNPLAKLFASIHC